MHKRVEGTSGRGLWCIYMKCKEKYSIIRTYQVLSAETGVGVGSGEGD